MADLHLYFPKVLPWAGGYVNDPLDKGGATKYDVTLATWRQVGYDKDGDGDIDAQDIKQLTPADAERVMRHYYWNRWRADEIKNQSVAECLVEWVWGSGKWGIVIPQGILKVTVDGVVGNRTIAAINAADPRQLHAQLVAAKVAFLNRICERDPSQKRFLKGWLNRIKAFPFQP